MKWLLARGRPVYLLLLAAFAIFTAAHATRLEVDHANEAMNARTPDERRVYEEFRQTFGDDAQYLLTVTRPDLLSPAGLRTVASLTSRIAELPGVARADSLTTVREIVAGPNGPEEAPLVRQGDRAALSKGVLEHRLARNPHLTGLLVSADRSTAAILIEPAKAGAQHPEALIASLRQIVADSGPRPAKLHLTGVAMQKHAVVVAVQRDQRVLVPAVIAMIALALALSFRRLSGVVLPLLVTAISVAGTLGCYQLAGLRLNPTTSLLAPAVMVLSISTSVHLYHGWLQSRVAEVQGRLIHVTRSLAAPCFVAALTTAFGFGSLAVSTMPAVRYFGVFAAFGVLLSFVVAITLVPVGLSFLAIPVAPGRKTSRPFDGVLRIVARLSTSRPMVVLAAAAAVAVVAAGGIPKITSNTDLVRFLSRDTPLYRDTMFIDRHLTGPNSLEVVVARRDGQSLDAADFARIEAFVQLVRGHPEVTGVWSILPLLAELRRADTGEAALRLPDDDDDLGAYLEMLELGDRVDLVRHLIDPEHKTVRLRLSVHAIGTARAARLLDALGDAARSTLGEGYEATPTGAFYSIVMDSNRLVRTQLETFTLAFALVFATIGLMFRSCRLMLVAVVPNLLPVLWTAGVMGYAGIELSSGTVMVASVVIGIAVDDTVHYLSRFLRERTAGEHEAIVRTTTGIGAALIVSSLVLAAGFWVGCLGSFRPTVHFSVLAGMTMLTALLCDLFVLPACLILTTRWSRVPG